MQFLSRKENSKYIVKEIKTKNNLKIFKLGMISKMYRPYYPLIYNFILYIKNPKPDKFIHAYRYNKELQGTIVYYELQKPISKI